MKFSVRFISGMLLTSLLAYAPLIQAERSKDDAGFVIFAVGNTWRIDHDGQKSELKSGNKIHRGDQLLTGDNGHIHLRMIDQAFIALRPDSTLELKTYQFEASSPEQDRARLELKKGSLRSVSGKLADRSKDRYRLNTPVAAIGVRGTDFTVVTTAVESQADVLQGGIAMSPFNSQCTQDSLGPCSGQSVIDLYAAMDQQFLKLRSGDTAPSLLDGRLLKLVTPQELNSLRTTTSKTSDNSSSTGDEGSETLPPNTSGDAATTDSSAAESDTTESNMQHTSGTEEAGKADTSAESESDVLSDNDKQSSDTQKPADTTQSDTTDSGQKQEVSDQGLSDSQNDEPASKAVRENTDLDGDGVSDLLDRFPNDPTEVTDTDGDGIGNNADTDDDNDGLSDELELMIGSNPLLSDSDGDGVIDGDDTEATRADSIKAIRNGQLTSLSEQAFSALSIEAVTFSPVKKASGHTHYESQMELSGGEIKPVKLVRSQTGDGRVFWGNEGSGRAWDKKVSTAITDTGYTPWANEKGISVRLENEGASTAEIAQHNSRWQKYYDTANFRPVVSNDKVYLSSTSGLESNPAISIDDPIRYLGVHYWLQDSDVVYQNSNGTSHTASVSHFSFRMQYTDRTFEAALILDVGGQPVQAIFNGTVNESGMIFGGKDNAYLKGFFVNELNQIALIFNVEEKGSNWAGTLVLDRDSLVYSPTTGERRMETFQSNSDQAIKWGRWSNFDRIESNSDLTAVLTSGEQLIAQNEVFALLRNSDNVTLPSEGVFSFDMNSSEAVFRSGEQLEVADVIDPSLTIDFNNRDFDTRMRVSSPTLSNGVEIYAKGGLGDNGIFTSDSNLSNSEVTGALSDGGSNAGMIFEHTMNDGVVSGAIDWRARTE